MHWTFIFWIKLFEVYESCQHSTNDNVLNPQLFYLIMDCSQVERVHGLTSLGKPYLWKQERPSALSM